MASMALLNVRQLSQKYPQRDSRSGSPNATKNGPLDPVSLLSVDVKLPAVGPLSLLHARFWGVERFRVISRATDRSRSEFVQLWRGRW